jgi:AcrR family transcriptional regulator
MQEGLEAEGARARVERRDARENRLLLLEVAKRLFDEQGVAATTMKQIASAAGVGKGTLYRHFADKGELCRAMIREDVAVFQERVGAQIADGQQISSPLKRLELLIAERIRLAERHLPLFAAIEEATSGIQEQARRFRGPFTAWTHGQIVRLLNEGIAQAEVAPLDVAYIADVLLAAMSPGLLHYQRHECGYSTERIIAGMQRLFVDCLTQRLPGLISPDDSSRR